MDEFTEEMANAELEQLSEALRLQEVERHEEWMDSLPQIKVISYGDYGYKAENPDDCLYGSEGACVSKSGDSICGCNYGGDTVYCSGTEELNRMKLKKSHSPKFIKGIQNEQRN